MAKSQQFSLHASTTKKPLFLLKREFFFFFSTSLRGNTSLKILLFLGKEIEKNAFFRFNLPISVNIICFCFIGTFDLFYL